MPGSCSELARVMMDIARYHVQQGATTIDQVVEEMQATMPGTDRQRLVDSILEVMNASKKEMTSFQKRLQKLKREAKQDKALQNSITELEVALASNTLPDKPGKKQTIRPEAIQNALDKKNALMKELAKSEPALIAKHQKGLSDAYERLADLSQGMSLPQVRTEEIDGSLELLKLRQERDSVQVDIRRAVEKLRPKTFWEKTIAGGNAARTIMASGEFSGVLRQGKYAVVGDPVNGIKAVRDMLKTFLDPKKALQVSDEILNSYEGQMMLKAHPGFFSDINGPLNQMEDNIMSPLAGGLPLIEGVPILSELSKLASTAYKETFVRFNIAYTTFLNSLRYNSTKALAGYAVDETPTMSEWKDLTNAVAVFTGRGSLGQFESSAAALNATMFSPRYFMSRIQMLTMQPVWQAANPSTRKAILTRMYGRSLVGMASLYSLYGVALGLDGDDEPSVGFSPLSSDFGKIKIGNVRLDPLAGLAQPTVLLFQIATGQKETLAGKKEAIRGKKKPFGKPSVITNFIRSKLAPAPGMAWDLIEGETVVGEKATIGDQILQIGTPMTYGDIADVMATDMGVPKKTAISILSFFGEGVQVYKNRASRR